MQNRFLRIALVLFFIGLLAFPLVYKRLAARNKVAATTAANPSAALARYGFALTESSKESGIAFKHSAPHLDAKLNHIMEQVASMGAAVSVVDFNRDGWQDIYVTNSGEGSKNALYQNLGNGTFRDVAEGFGLDGMNSRENGVSMGAVWGDYDNDGFEDLFLYKWG